MRQYIIASHRLMAYGFADTLKFLTAKENILDISAYVDETDLEVQIAHAFEQVSAGDELIIMTDMLGGSVNQKLCAYMSDTCHLICGINLPCALSLVLIPEEHPITSETIRRTIEESKNHLIYVNEYDNREDEADE